LTRQLIARLAAVFASLRPRPPEPPLPPTRHAHRVQLD